MDKSVWSLLRNLESHDAIADWFNRIHNKKLSSMRAKEIVSSSRQAREYFRNSSLADYSVKPLLTFYGVSSLTKAVTLLFSRASGECSLTKGHGLSTSAWSEILRGELSDGLRNIPKLKVEVTKGLFSDFLRHSHNRTCIHVDSSAVQWRIHYPTLPENCAISFEEILSKIPDLNWQYTESFGVQSTLGRVNKLKYGAEGEFRMNFYKSASCKAIDTSYAQVGFDRLETPVSKEVLVEFKHPKLEIFPIQLLHRSNEGFPVPSLYVAPAFQGGFCLSELGVLYVLSYFTGMLARYFPTHWISLIQGDQGDIVWPLLSSAQDYVQAAYPKLVYELVQDALQNSFFENLHLQAVDAGPDW